MSLMKFNRCVIRVTLALSLAVGCAHAMAFEPDPLKGPKVKDSGVPGENRKFGGGGEGQFDREQILPHRSFVRCFDVLRGEKAGALKLSAEQEAQLKSADQAFRAEMDTYRAKHKDEARTLLADLPPEARRRAMELLGVGGPRDGQGPGRERGPAREKGQRPERGPDAPPMDGGEKPVNTEKAEAAKARLRELFEGAPKPDEVHTKMFAVLSAEQKAAVEKELESARKQMQDRRQEMYKERVKKDIKGKMDEAGKDGAMDPAKVREFIQGLPDDERQKIKDMDPKERREYVRKLWESRKDR
jgi:hypothetical protein